MASIKSDRAEEKPGEVETEAEVETKCPQCHHRPSTILGTLQVSDLYHDGLYGPFRGRIRAAVCPGGWCLVTGVLARLSPQNMGQGKNWAGSCESGPGPPHHHRALHSSAPQLLSRLTHSSSSRGVGLQI